MRVSEWLRTRDWRNESIARKCGSPLPLWAYSGRFRNSPFLRMSECLGDAGLANQVAILNQVQIAASGSPLPSWAYRGRFWNSSAPVILAKAGIQRVSAKFATGNQVQIAAIGSLLPLWEKARMRVRRAPARLCGRDARAPRPQTYPSKPFMGEGLGEGDARKRGCGSGESWAQTYPCKPIKEEGIRCPRFHGDDAIEIRT